MPAWPCPIPIRAADDGRASADRRLGQLLPIQQLPHLLETSTRRWFFIPTGIDQAFSTTHRATAFGGTGVLLAKSLRAERCTTDYIAAVRRVADRMTRLNVTRELERPAVLTLGYMASASDEVSAYEMLDVTATTRSSWYTL